MPDLLLMAVEYGGYISLIKFAIFLGVLFLWLWTVTWVHTDAQSVDTGQPFWTGMVFAAGALGSMIWLVLPLFVIGLVLFLVGVGTTALAYVNHRNARVMDYDRILTADHIKTLFSSKKDKLDDLKSFVFVTANNNEVPLPEPRTPDFFGYKTAHDIFSDAIWRRASDVIFAPTAQDYQVIYQVDGAALKQPSVPREQLEYFVRFIKHLADLDSNEKRKPQKGSFRIHRGKDSTEWQVMTAGSTAGEQIILKQRMQQSITRLSEIGLMPEQQEQLGRLREVRQGLFLITGPRKSGITTTFYALLRNHDAFINSIHTMEIEPSAELPNITQEVFSLSDTGTTTFSKKLQTMVRMGPDICGVAQCQDSETARICCGAAKDGKIVYVTLEAESVMRALDKWVQLVGDKNAAVESLLGVDNQRLPRRLCEECKQAYAPNKELLRKFSIPADKAKVLYRAGKVQYDKHGKPFTCEACQGTGFMGRTGVFELIVLNRQMRQALQEARSSAEIGALFRSAKMLYVQEQALRKVMAGMTSINEMVRVLSRPRDSKPKGPQQAQAP
ncbi:MAG: GspE/PulE family protein [Planctomycetota bacterium]|jgi:general secretion pathway protein E